MISSIEKYRKVLLDNVQNMKNKRRQELELQLNNFKQLNKSVMKSVVECQQIATGKDDDKYNKMKQAIEKNETEQKIDIDTEMINIKLEIKKDDKLFKSGMEQGLLVEFTDEKLDIESIDTEIMRKSKILESKEIRYLTKILPKELKNNKYELLFRATRDGFQASTFHSKCDNRGETISIIQSTNNHIFGGYTSKPWSGISKYVRDEKAFIFLLRSTQGNVPQKWTPTKVPGCATYHHTGKGPTFGGGHDLCIGDNCNTSKASYANLGYSYDAPQDQNLLAGSYKFNVKDYEVWQIKR